MKKTISLFACLFLSVFIPACCSSNPPQEAQYTNAPEAIASTQASLENYVVAYYFHGNYRCTSCLRIEQYSKEAIEKYYAEELKSGNLVFKVINVEEKGNEHYIQDYKLYTKSLVLSLVKEGKEAKSENLSKVWELLNDKEGFYEYVRNSTDNYLSELPK